MGLASALLKALSDASPETMSYISCHLVGRSYRHVLKNESTGEFLVTTSGFLGDATVACPDAGAPLEWVGPKPPFATGQRVSRLAHRWLIVQEPVRAPFYVDDLRLVFRYSRDGVYYFDGDFAASLFCLLHRGRVVGICTFCGPVPRRAGELFLCRWQFDTRAWFCARAEDTLVTIDGSLSDDQRFKAAHVFEAHVGAGVAGRFRRFFQGRIDCRAVFVALTSTSLGIVAFDDASYVPFLAKEPVGCRAQDLPVALVKARGEAYARATPARG